MDGEEQNALNFDSMRDVDHAASMALCQKGDLKVDTVIGCITAYRLLLGAIDRKNPSALIGPLAQQVTPETVAWLVNDFQPRFSARSMATTLRSLVGFCSAAIEGHDVQFIRDLAQKFERRAAESPPSNRRKFALSADKIPPQLVQAYQAFAPTAWYAKEFRRYLGAQEKCGLRLASLQLATLGSDVCLSNFEAILGHAATADRINQLGCVLKKADKSIDVSLIFKRACELRQKDSENAELYDRRSADFDQLPDQVQKRFLYATKYDGTTDFEIDGVAIPLAKARTLKGHDYSDDEVYKMKLALRMHYTILAACDSTLAENWQDWGTRRALDLYKWFYSGSSPITQASRLEDLIAALRAIFGDVERKLFHAERRQIQLLMGVARKFAEPLIVPFLPTRKIRCRARAIATKALARLRDLRSVDKPYRDPVRLAALFRTALIVAILAELPLRLRTLSLLSFEIVEKQESIYTVSIPPDAMKKREGYFATFSHSLSKLIGIWINEVRPFLLADREQIKELFISDEGRPLSRSAFQTSVPKFMESFFNKERINIHLFRNLHASELVEDGEAASWTLQHSDRESKRTYQGAQQLRDRDRTSSLRAQSEGFFR